jgi:hypothetical protein
MQIVTRKRRRRMTPLAYARRQLQQFGPYQSLGLILLPILLVEPLKVMAVFVAGDGHWLAGTGILVAAYASTLVFVERLFKVVKPRLMTMNWFASIWTWFAAARDKAWRRFRAGVRKRFPAMAASER